MRVCIARVAAGRETEGAKPGTASAFQGGAPVKVHKGARAIRTC